MIDRIAVGRGDRALLNGADDPRGRGAREPEWVADRDDGIPDLHGARVPELERGQTPRARVDAEHGDVGGGVAADERGPHRVAVREADLDLVGTLDHVVVRDDVAGLVDDEARAQCLLRLRGRLTGRDRGAGGIVRAARRRGDLDDTRRGTRVDLADRQPVVANDRSGGDRGRGGPDDSRRAAAQVAHERDAAERDQAAEDGHGDEGCGAGKDGARVHGPRCIREVLTRSVGSVKYRLRSLNAIAGEGDCGRLLARLAVGAQRLVELGLQLTALEELLDDVRAADELSLDEDLWDRRPARERRELLANLRVRQDVDSRDRRARGAKCPQRAVRVAAHDELGRALHEQAHRLVLDDLLDLVAQLAHVIPLVLIRSSWIDPSPSGAASAS